jgi:tetratricopeptide (TPR) repeat protein
LAYLNRAMLLAPAWISPRLVAARYLARHGHFDQGLLEVREALERDPSLAASEACVLLQARPTAETLLRMAARNEHRTTSLVALVGCMPPDAEHADEVDVAILESEPSLVEPRVRLIERAIRRGQLDAAWARAGQWTEGEAPTVTLARGRLELASARPQQALESAERAESFLEDPWPAVVLRARAHAALGDWLHTRDTVGELRGRAGSDVSRLGDAEVLLGELEAQGGHRGQALAAYEGAWRAFERLDALIEVARLARDLDDEPRAVAARRTLCERDVTEYCTPVP